MPTLDELQEMGSKFRGKKSGSQEQLTFLPEPARRARAFPIISVDDHVVEPPHTFHLRLPARLQDRAPRVVEEEGGNQVWLYEHLRESHTGLNAVVGRPIEECGMEPTRFEAMRKGAWDPRARVSDMDINGVYASLNFPSALPGFAGQRLQLGGIDDDLALATVRAWNDWLLEEWVEQFPERFVACQLPWLRDPEVAAQEIRRNAERGFRAVTFSEAPDKLGLPSLHGDYWEPFMQACEDTGTVLCLHVGSSSTSPDTSPEAPPDTIGVLFFGYAMFSAVDWLYSMIPVRHPMLRICMSEGGIGWVAGLMDRLNHVLRYQELYGTWDGIDLTPAEVLQRNFSFCAIDDPSGFLQVDKIGPGNLMVESDYPHLDSTWPDTQPLLQSHLANLDAETVRKVTHENAAELFRHPVPQSVVADPESF
jgi:predicted TIM-barrel fold metal-dependent hydrolase